VAQGVGPEFKPQYQKKKKKEKKKSQLSVSWQELTFDKVFERAQVCAHWPWVTFV
jgi:hypothetical protein